MAFNKTKKMNNDSIHFKQIHLGFSILKSLLAFNVIISHCFRINTTKNKIILFICKRRRFHVPSFVILSFYFNHNTLISTDTKKKLNRFERLIIPYLGWPIITFIFSNIIKYFKKFSILCSFKILIFQLITGQGNWVFHFWYLFDLILTTFIFHLIIIIFRKRYLFILNLLLLFSYFIQYSKYSKMLYYYTNKLAGLARENEIIPFAITGFTLSSLKALNICEKFKINSFLICLIIYNLLQDYEIFANLFGVAYSGIKLNVISICVIIIFSLFPLNNKPKNLIKILKYITNYSGGIFYLHQVIHFYFKYILLDIQRGTFIGVIMIYFISYCICVLGTSIFKTTKAKNLFS